MNIHDNCIGGTANDFTGTEFFNAAGLYAGGNQLFIGFGGGLESEEKGKAKGRIEVLAELVKNGIITVFQAAEQEKMTVEEFKAKAGLTAV